MAKKKILLIDFDNEFIKFLSRALTDEGYEVVTATDGLAGFEKFSEIHPDLVIMEAMLPKFHGFELCSRITSHPTKKSPVIIVTGIYKDAVYKTEALKNLGASAYFEKPLNLEELMAKVYELAGKSEAKVSVSQADQELDQLLKEALEGTASEKKRPETSGKKEVSPKPASVSKDEEIDLILKSKLKDLISETNGLESKPAKAPSFPRTEKTIKPEKPAEPKKAEPLSRPSPPPTAEPVKRPGPTVSPAEKKKKEAPIFESKTEPIKETKPEPRKEEAKLTPSPVPAQDKLKASAGPAFSPFKGYLEEEKKDENKKKSSGVFIGVAAAILVVIAAVAIFTLKKKEAPAYNARPSNQAAALQTVGSEQPKEQPAEEDINKEIENQIAAYRQQKSQSGNINGSPAGIKNQAPTGKSVNKVEAAAVPITPVMPQETPQLAINTNTNPNAATSQQQNAINQDKAASGVANNDQGSQTESTTSNPQTKAEEQPVAIPVPKVKTGDLLPLSMVDVEPKAIKTVEPVYPETDRRMGIKGNVTLNVLISETGDVLEVAVIRGLKGSVGLEKEAVNAVKKWKFLPAEKDGVKVKVWKPITIGFGLTK
ncbi:MAG: TonB family protein [Candidatus Saccharicenans sp.]